MSAEFGGESYTLTMHKKKKLAERRSRAARGREIGKELNQMARELIANCLLDKHWRDGFLS